MQIDWFTFAAQIVNFLILVWLLKRFLYGPIVNAMAEREERIADRFDEARKKEETAEAEAAEYRQKREALERSRAEKLEEAEEAARERRRELIEEARAEADRLEAQWRASLRRERDTFLQELAQRASRETLVLARRALDDLAHADLEAQVVRVFVDRIEALDEDRRQTLAEAVEAEPETVTVRTAFEVDDDQKQPIVDALRAATGTEATPAFERDEELGFGIELRAGGHKIAWSLDSYVSGLADRVRARIDAEIGREEASSPPEQNEATRPASASHAPSEDAPSR
jgi:F-type H+-transporting ATPase subunit b